MNTQETLLATQMTSATVIKMYLDDLSDADLMRRPGPGCNHIAWQLGHLISSECGLLESIAPGSAPALPKGFKEQHHKDQAGVDDPTKFCTKAEYLELFDTVQAATRTLIGKLSDADLDAPAPEHFRSMFPTVGHIVVLIASHPLMHAGQFAPVRRALGKPVVI